MSFTPQDYRDAAIKLAILPIAEVKAVATVESNGVTHWPDGRVPIRPEAHIFSADTGHIYDQSHPHISSPVWNPALAARTGDEAYAQFAEMSALNRIAAILATSWGGFQVLGQNWQALGYASPDAFVAAMQTPAGQIDGFVRYIRRNGLDGALRNHDWTALARGYNGEGQVEYYATLMAEAFAAGTHPGFDFDVRELQRRLGGVTVDGQFGPLTKAAVIRFQREHGLVPDGIVGPLTLAALGML